MGVRSRRHYIGFTFAGLWIIGFLSGIILLIMIAKNFQNSAKLEEEEIATIRNTNRVYVDVEKGDWKRHGNDFFGIDVDNDWPLYSVGDDSVLLNTVKLSIAKSNDSAYHVYRIKESRGSRRNKAISSAQKIDFVPLRTDSIVELPQGFFISNQDKFRNQRVWIVFEVPVGKRIGFDKSTSMYKWFNVRNDRNRFSFDEYDDEYDYYRDRPQPGEEYVMKPDGRPEKITN